MEIFNNYLTPWRKKDESNEDLNKDYYILTFLSKIMNLYEIKCEEIETKSFDILKYGFINGHCGLKKFADGKFYVGVGTYTGELDSDGHGKDYTINLRDGRTETGTIGKDVVVFTWNNLHISIFPQLEFYADMLSKADTSMLYNILYSRVCPVPIVENDNEQKSIENVIKDLMSGKLSIFKREQKTHGFYDATKTENKKDVLELTNPQASTYMQNLSRFHDEMIIRLCLEFGVYVSSRDKGAQLNDKELDAFKDYCVISSDDTFERLKKFSENAKNVLGLNIEVKAKNFVYTNEDIVNEEDIISMSKQENNEDNED